MRLDRLSPSEIQRLVIACDVVKNGARIQPSRAREPWQHGADLPSSVTLCRLPSMGRREPRLTAQGLKLLGVFMESPNDEFSGAEIARRTALASGTLYPLLARLEESRWLLSRWERGDPVVLGRPRRRLYRITALGRKHASAAVAEIRASFGGLAWS